MLTEAGVAVTAGITAGSLALTSFGFDSVIELVSATLVLRRLRAGLRGSHPDEQAERRKSPGTATRSRSRCARWAARDDYSVTVLA